MRKLVPALAVAGMLAAGAASAASAIGDRSTIGELLAQGTITPAAVEQLIQTTGLTMDEARQMTLDEVVAERWQDS
jgi:hypothetical protein